MHKQLGTKRARTRNSILQCAEKLLLKNGYIHTDLSQIAAMVGIDKRTIYRYFESKEALAFAVWGDVLSQLMDIGMDIDVGSGYENLKKMLEVYVDSAIERRDRIKFLGEFDHMFSGEYPKIEEAEDFISYIQTNKSAVTLYINQGVADQSIRNDIDVDLVSSTISNMMLALCQRIVIREKHLKEEQGYAFEMLNEAIKIILTGIER